MLSNYDIDVIIKGLRLVETPPLYLIKYLEKQRRLSNGIHKSRFANKRVFQRGEATCDAQ